MLTMRKYILLMLVSVWVSSAAWCQSVDHPVGSDVALARHQVLLETSKGNIRLELYDETPKHRDNFLKLVREGYYDGILWHRVIADFMIQTGDSTSRHAMPGTEVGQYDIGYTLPAEIVYPRLFHKRGALAAAREGDEVNPERASSGAQFYITYGYVYGDRSLDKVQTRLDERTGGQVKLTSEVRQYYKEHGGTPHLDGQYTVFGEVVEGMDVVQRIDYVETDAHDRPLEDVRILRATVVR